MLISKILKQASVIPVLEGDDVDTAPELAMALARGGLSVVEMTMRSKTALEIMQVLKKTEPTLIVGMGTIRSQSDVERAKDAGADFLVSPGASRTLLKHIKASGLPALPGVATVSEAMAAQEEGFNALKFFPAEAAGGIPYLKSIFGPLPDIVFCPTGSITEEKAPAYLALPNVACVGGSWIASKAMIANKEWDKIEANARKAAAMKK